MLVCLSVTPGMAVTMRENNIKIKCIAFLSKVKHKFVIRVEIDMEAIVSFCFIYHSIRSKSSQIVIFGCRDVVWT